MALPIHAFGSKRFSVCKQIEAAEIVDLRPSAVEQICTMDNNCKALCTTDRHVEAVGIEQEFRSTRRIDALGSHHGNNNDGSLLSLEFVHRADLYACGQNLFEEIDLQIVGCNDQNVRHGERRFLTATRDFLPAKFRDQSNNHIRFGAARLRAAVVRYWDEGKSCRLNHRICARTDDETALRR